MADVAGILTEQSDTDGTRNYWKVLKNRLKKEGSQLVTNCNRLKMIAKDGNNQFEISKEYLIGFIANNEKPSDLFVVG